MVIAVFNSVLTIMTLLQDLNHNDWPVRITVGLCDRPLSLHLPRRNYLAFLTSDLFLEIINEAEDEATSTNDL